MPFSDVLLLVALIGAGALPFAAGWWRATRRAKAEARRGALLAEALEVTPCNFAVYDDQRILLACNDAYRALHATAFATLPKPIRYESLMRTTLSTMVAPDLIEAELARRVDLHENGEQGPQDRLYPGGQWMRVGKRRLRGGEVAGIALDVSEIRDREAALARSEARYRALLDNAPVGIWHVDAAGLTVFANDRLLRLFPGHAAPDRIDRAGLCLPPATDPAHPFGFRPGCETEITLRRPDGSTATLLIAASPWLTGGDAADSVVLTVLDISALEAARAQLEHLARHDPLTGLGNRDAFRAALEGMLAEGRGGALLVGDLDGFKAANDRYGHDAGDALLVAVAQRMRQLVRGGDTVCRLGGDEFALVLPGADVATVTSVAARLNRLVGAPVPHGGAELRVGISIGIALAPDHGTTAEALQRAADLALYDVKGARRGAAMLFEPSLRIAADGRITLRDALATALAEDELVLHFQPQLALATRALVGAEALLRWPSRRLQRSVPPMELLVAATEARLLPALDAWVLETAVRHLASWTNRTDAPPLLAINISAVSLRDAGFADWVAGVLLAAGVSAERLEIEVPEDLAVRDLDALAAPLRRLREIGVRLALDDFGSGLSSLMHVIRLPVQRLKIDRSIVAGLDGAIPTGAVLRATLALARGMNIDVLAEGVETEAQAFALRREGCLTGQGYLLGRPMPESALLAPAALRSAG
jgi:diguanylate cyclase (GGDEF)-like protein